jgi:hypothetical protein
VNRSGLKFRGNYLAVITSMLMGAVFGCASHSESSGVQMPANAVAPSADSVRDLGDFGSVLISDGSGAAIDEKSLEQSAGARGFDFGDNGGGGGAGPLSFDQLGQMLANIGTNPNAMNGIFVFNVNEADIGIVHPVDVTFSRNQSIIFFILPVCHVTKAWANHDSLLRLLIANGNICPASFSIIGQSLSITMGIPNNNVSADTLKRAISYVDRKFRESRPLWVNWLQNGNPGPGGGPLGQ